MKPLKTLLFLLGVFAILALVSVAFPKDGLSFDFDIALKFPTIKEVFNPEKVEYADISNLINTDSLIQEEVVKIDSITRDTIRADANELSKNVQKLQYANGNKEVLYTFFRKLRGLNSNSELIRILHYGDSQVEGDRISSDLRFKLQSQFGGNGPGLISVKDVTNTASIKRAVSADWQRYTTFGKTSEDVKHKKYGAMLSFSRFAPIQDSIVNDSVFYEGWLQLRQSPLTYQRTKEFNQLRIFYGYNQKPFTIELFDGEEKIIQKDSLLPRNSATTLVYNFDETPKELNFKFRGKDSPDFYAVAMDGASGIAVDNIPLRGSAGLDFAKTDLTFLAKMYDYLNVKCLILEFGVNVVPNVVEDYSFYENWFYSNLRALKRIAPDVGDCLN